MGSDGVGGVLVVGEAKDLDPAAVGAALQTADARVVTIAAVVGRRTRLALWAPLSGQTTLAKIDKDASAEACDAARRCSADLPADVSTRYRTADCWTTALELLAEHGTVIVVGAPRRRRDRRVVARSLAAGDHLAVFGSVGGHQ